MNNESNFSIGTDGNIGVDSYGNTFDLTVTANVIINGSCYTFGTLGGDIALPQESGVTGQGGIFVDKLGTLSLINNRIAGFGAMVTKSPWRVLLLAKQSGIF